VSSAKRSRLAREPGPAARLDAVTEADAPQRRTKYVAQSLGLSARRRLTNVGEKVWAQSAPVLTIRAPAAKKTRKRAHRRGYGRYCNPAARNERGTIEFRGKVQDRHGGCSISTEKEPACSPLGGETS
jgi:hypothetical protein